VAKINLPAENEFVGEWVGDYELSNEIGKGNIGVVYKAQHRRTPDVVAACKIIPKENLKEDWIIEMALRCFVWVTQYPYYPLKQIT
jgi:serine/threonine protein kinase